MFSEFKSGADQYFFFQFQTFWKICKLIHVIHMKIKQIICYIFPFLSFFLYLLCFFTLFPIFFFNSKGGGVQLPWLPTPSESSNTHCFLIIMHGMVLDLACLHRVCLQVPLSPVFSFVTVQSCKSTMYFTIN